MKEVTTSECIAPVTQTYVNLGNVKSILDFSQQMEIFLSILWDIQVARSPLFSFSTTLIVLSAWLSSPCSGTVQCLLTVLTKLQRGEHAPYLSYACTFFLQVYITNDLQN